MPSPLNIHIVLQPPYPEMFDETEQLLWERNGRAGKAQRYKVETVRFALTLANKYLKAEKEKTSAEAQVPVGSPAA